MTLPLDSHGGMDLHRLARAMGVDPEQAWTIDTLCALLQAQRRAALELATLAEAWSLLVASSDQQPQAREVLDDAVENVRRLFSGRGLGSRADPAAEISRARQALEFAVSCLDAATHDADSHCLGASCSASLRVHRDRLRAFAHQGSSTPDD